MSRLLVRHSLTAAVKRLDQTQTLHAKASLTLNLSPRVRGRERPITRVAVVVEGDVQTPHTAPPAMTGSLSIRAQGRGTELFATGALRLFKDAVAFRLEEIPILINPSGSLQKKWTYVAAPALETKNGPDIRAVFSAATKQFHYEGKVQHAGQRAAYYTGKLSPETAQKLAQVFSQSTSHNRALNVVARLLKAYDVKSLEAWVGPDNALTIAAVFVRPLPTGKTFETARLELAFSEYGKPVSVDRPPQQSTVKPAVFAKLFGTGQLQAQ